MKEYLLRRMNCGEINLGFKVGFERGWRAQTDLKYASASETVTILLRIPHKDDESIRV